MDQIIRSDIQEEYAYSGTVEAGGFVFLSFCVGNVGQGVEAQIRGAFDDMERRLRAVGLGLDAVVKIDVLFRDVWNIPVLEKVIKERFTAGYPARKTVSTDFAHVGGPAGLEVQIDGIAWRRS